VPITKNDGVPAGKTGISLEGLQERTVGFGGTSLFAKEHVGKDLLVSLEFLADGKPLVIRKGCRIFWKM